MARTCLTEYDVTNASMEGLTRLVRWLRRDGVVFHIGSGRLRNNRKSMIKWLIENRYVKENRNYPRFTF